MRHRSIRARHVAAIVAFLAAAACGPAGDPGEAASVETANEPDAIQPLPVALPQSGAVVASQGAAVSQNLGHAQITIVYNRPVARGRVIFGNLVPFDEVWHPGADRATYLRTTADILFGGEPLPAGTYSLWTVPGRDEWEVILHRDWDVFHLPFPGEEGVALRIRVAPRSATHMETMAFYFPVADRRTGALAFHWADTMVEIPLAAPGTTAP
ncbi:MAG: DUF2911 domain-containing protein [Gemmatimonadota bacterium]|nr:DUF2911 domain-containing protein [Gemmatimonadota bacterium]